MRCVLRDLEGEFRDHPRRLPSRPQIPESPARNSRKPHVRPAPRGARLPVQALRHPGGGALGGGTQGRGTPLPPGRRERRHRDRDVLAGTHPRTRAETHPGHGRRTLRPGRRHHRALPLRLLPGRVGEEERRGASREFRSEAGQLRRSLLAGRGRGRQDDHGPVRGERGRPFRGRGLPRLRRRGLRDPAPEGRVLPPRPDHEGLPGQGRFPRCRRRSRRACS